MEIEDIRKMSEVYICQRCSMAFIFKDDVEDHKRDTGHMEFLHTALEDLR